MDFDAIKIKKNYLFQCKECGKKFCRKKWADRHEEKCIFLTSKGLNSSKAEKYSKHKAAETIYICNHCDKTFYTDRSLQIHSFVEHNESNTYTCKPCGKTFAYKHYLKKHAVVHELENRFKCDFCEILTTFKTQLYLHQHLLKFHFNI
ncbi:hypothetical protein KM759_gp038 [Lymphocystis disease virus 4]|uniref:C2H2-type domain-containing protein n=1 Tax=Lymphocystis disease virus 4 TaxID=2704413 RepID=A0A6B9XN27_9VIRU|nr:hypothetical protein KM759_gp038 [Lymphocystis disease virus 4]QHR78532.1 hypothetical protein [Lymphocystis disease virus 4]